MQTGLKAIDSLIQLEEVQKELVATDKLEKSHAIDTIINQKEINKSDDESKKLYCVYVAIGQKKTDSSADS